MGDQSNGWVLGVPTGEHASERLSEGQMFRDGRQHALVSERRIRNDALVTSMVTFSRPGACLKWATARSEKRSLQEIIGWHPVRPR